MKHVDLKQTAIALAHALIPDPKFSDVDKCFEALLRQRGLMQEEIVRNLRSWGDQCCGGSGGSKLPDGSVVGERYYSIADMLAERPVIEN